MAGSVTGWIDSLKCGSDDAAQALWERLFSRLCRRIAPYSRSLRLSDDEDIASGTFAEFCDAIRSGKFENIANRTELWQLLATMAVRKTRDCHKYENAICRGGDYTIHSLQSMPSDASIPGVDGIGPQAIEAMLRDLTVSIDDEELKNVLQLKVQGHDNQEIALKIGCSIRTVQYMVKELTIELAKLAAQPEFAS